MHFQAASRRHFQAASRGLTFNFDILVGSGAESC